MNVIREITKKHFKVNLPSFKPGDRVRVYFSITEGEKERVQPFEGDVIRIHRNGIGTTFTVRKHSYGIGVERIFPLHSPLLKRVEMIRRGDVRRAKLYYLRKLTGRKAKIKELRRN